MHRLIRAVPALLVGALFALAVLASDRQAVPRAAVTTDCDLLQSGGAGYYVLVPYAGGVTQPVPFLGNVVACSLGTGVGRVDLVSWDPLALAPDPTTVALRTRSFDASAVQYGYTRITLSPPLVMRTVEHLAEPPRPMFALDYHAVYGSDYASYQTSGQPATPMGLQFAPNSSRVPLPGAHPLVTHIVCGGDAATQGLDVVQSVMTTSLFYDTTSQELIQRFRVPVPTRVHWVELAFGPVTPRLPWGPGAVALFDGNLMPDPAVALPTPLVQAPIAQNYWGTPTWDTHLDFDHFVTLQANHDYWLLVRTNHGYGVYARIGGDVESDDFRAGIGPLFTRTTSTGNWNVHPLNALSFRVIGEPLTGAEIGVVPLPAPSRLRLAVTPNPAHGAALVRWSGGAERVRFTVLDARGRRVGGGEAAGGEGGWLWRATREDGRAVSAGVYFVRATDGRGGVATTRVVVVR